MKYFVFDTVTPIDDTPKFKTIEVDAFSEYSAFIKLRKLLSEFQINNAVLINSGPIETRKEN